MFHVKQLTMKQQLKCHNCLSTNSKLHRNCADFLTQGDTFEVWQCLDCQLEWTNTNIKGRKLAAYYKNPGYISHTDCKTNILERCYHVARNIAMVKKSRIIGKGNGTLLEIGSGTGGLLSYCRQKGWKVIGIEPNKTARVLALKKNKVKLLKQFKFRELEHEKIDSIMMWHVFEHIRKPKKMMRKIGKLMNDKSKLIIAAPNSNANEIAIYKKYWAAYDVPRHLFHYNRKSIKHMAEENGLEIKKIVPLWFDALYISIISERIKGNKLAFFRGLVVGCWSNLKAFLQNKEYSSLVFILTKKDDLKPYKTP